MDQEKDPLLVRNYISKAQSFGSKLVAFKKETSLGTILGRVFDFHFMGTTLLKANSSTVWIIFLL
jgi:hypothetical protein